MSRFTSYYDDNGNGTVSLPYGDYLIFIVKPQYNQTCILCNDTWQNIGALAYSAAGGETLTYSQTSTSVTFKVTNAIYANWFIIKL